MITGLCVTENIAVIKVPRQSQHGVIYHGNSLSRSMCKLSYYYNYRLPYLLIHIDQGPRSNFEIGSEGGWGTLAE